MAIAFVVSIFVKAEPWPPVSEEAPKPDKRRLGHAIDKEALILI